MSSSSSISHIGIVCSVGDGIVKIRILQQSACSSCKIASHCATSESKEKIIDIYTANSTDYALGQQVNVVASSKVGFKAVVLGFVIPLILMIATIAICLALVGTNEGIAATGGILVLVPYCMLLYSLRSKLQSTLAFQIE